MGEGVERLKPTGTDSLLPLEPRNSDLVTFISKLHPLKITEVGRSILTGWALMGTKLHFNSYEHIFCSTNLKGYLNFDPYNMT